MDVLIFFFLEILSVSCINFNVNNVKEIKLNEVGTGASTYFGYKLLLQKGSGSIVIVGAPKYDAKFGGALFTCDALNDGGCQKYEISAGTARKDNFLGSALDGEDNKGRPFIVCAPRYVVQQGLSKVHHYLKGYCVFQRNSAELNDTKTVFTPLHGKPTTIEVEHSDGRPSSIYYDKAFGQAGSDVHYIGEMGRALLGAPGIKNWNGAIVSQSLEGRGRDSTIIPINDTVYERMDLLGYTVTSARIRGTTYYVAGAPRAKNLLGMVKLFEGIQEFKSFKGDEVGSYFGSSIVSQDVNNDKREDLFIGAPMGKGSTFEEGYVYVYENAGRKTAKLVGSQKSAARFGTSIAALGDIDLDSYKDIAVSAPFEDDGVGAVYIYKGSRLGIATSFVQRLSPSHFDGNFINVRGFGVGLSRGNDIDGNGHNDLAVGAYKSGQVFILRTKSVIDYKLSLEANVTTLEINDANDIQLKYCVYYSKRSKVKDLQFVDFNLTFSLDYRVQGQRIRSTTIRSSIENSTCDTIDVKTVPTPALTPFSISMSPKVPENILAIGESKVDELIHFSHGCGDDEVCQTRITLDLVTDKSSIVLGLDRQIVVSLTVKNEGEPGYQCQLHLQVPDEVRFRREKECNSENDTSLVCPFTTTLITEKKLKFEFEITSDRLSSDNIEIGFDVECSGENLEPNSAKTATVGIVVKNSPYIEGKSYTPNVYYDEETEDIEMSHSFVVGNSGPSPFKLDVHLLLPMVQEDGANIFEIVDTKATSQGVQFFCQFDDQVKEYKNVNSLESQLTVPNKTIVIDCLQEDSRCLEIMCRGENLYVSELAKINVKVGAKTKLLDEHFRKHLQKNDALGYITIGFIPGTERIQSSSMALIMPSQRTKPVPIWVWILAALLGIIVLFVLIFLLYKCHFFDRNYRDKMNDEQLMDDEMNENGEPIRIFDDTLEDVPEDEETTEECKDVPSQH